MEMTVDSKIVSCYNALIVIDKNLYNKYLKGM